MSDWNSRAAPHRHISLWVREDGGGNDLASRPPCSRLPTDAISPLLDYCGCGGRLLTIIAGARPLGALMKSHCERLRGGSAKEMDDEDDD